MVEMTCPALSWQNTEPSLKYFVKFGVGVFNPELICVMLLKKKTKKKKLLTIKLNSSKRYQMDNEDLKERKVFWFIFIL